MTKEQAAAVSRHIHNLVIFQQLGQMNDVDVTIRCLIEALTTPPSPAPEAEAILRQLVEVWEWNQGDTAMSRVVGRASAFLSQQKGGA